MYLSTPHSGSSGFSYGSCHCCPRQCGVDRTRQFGYCHSPAQAVAARAALHPWEEPCLSGLHGSGTIFFSGCTLRCCFCQNHKISWDGFGKPVSSKRLSEIILELQDQGAHNINLVTATQYLPTLLEVLPSVKPRLSIPIVYNCGGYETIEAIDALAPYVDIWLPDLKYFSPDLSARYSGAEDYFKIASAAILRMIFHSGPPVFQDFREKNASISLLQSGVLLRHMVLPGQKEDSIRLLHWIHDTLPSGHFLLSLLSQYTPAHKSRLYPELNRRLTRYEYEKVVDTALSLGLDQGFRQEKSSAREEYTPPFSLQGI